MITICHPEELSITITNFNTEFDDKNELKNKKCVDFPCKENDFIIQSSLYTLKTLNTSNHVQYINTDSNVINKSVLIENNFKEENLPNSTEFTNTIDPLNKLLTKGNKYLLPYKKKTNYKSVDKNKNNVYIKKKPIGNNYTGKNSYNSNFPITHKINNSSLQTSEILNTDNNVNSITNSKRRLPFTPTAKISRLLDQERTVLKEEIAKKKLKMLKLDSYINKNVPSFNQCLSERTNFLHAYGRDLSKNREKQKEENQRQKLEAEYKECTFKPKINPIEKLAQIFNLSSDNISNILNSSTTSKYPYLDRVYNWQSRINEK